MLYMTKQEVREMDKFKAFYMKYLHNAGVLSFALAFLLNFIIEACGRLSVVEAVQFLFGSPLVFLYNVLIIFMTLTITLLVRRRVFVYVVVSIAWLALGITNGIILSNRMTPFTVKDIAVLDGGLDIVTQYLSTTQIILAAIGIILGLIALGLFFWFGPKRKEKINYKRNIALFLVFCIGMFGATNLAIKTNVVGTFFGNLAYAYLDYGTPYCFINTWLNTGIKQPDGYNAQMIQGIFENGEFSEFGYSVPANEDDGKKNPNIIFLQMESFIDPTQVKSLEFSQDPVPNYRRLLAENSSGFLTVPAVGAGTANTEFEMLTGMSVKFFGPGEYPHKSILKEETCESVPYLLKGIGYSTHAIHNHRGAFYGRNKVFKNLGFDTYTSLEYMNHVVKTPKNWAKDGILVEQIFDALNATDTEDFLYTCSVQGHGKYPTEQVLEDPVIKVTKAPTEELKWQYEYYVNQLYEMDLFLADLTSQLEAFDEDVLLVVYGDHLPALDMTEDDLLTNSLFETQYFIWSNFDKPLKKINKDLYTYQVASTVFDRLGIDMGVMMKYHQNYVDSPDYKKNMEALEYDMIYGNRYIFGGTNPYLPTDLRMGVKPIKVTEVVRIGERLYIKGENFTVYSKISLDGEILKTIFLGPSILGLQEEVDLDSAERMKVSQVESQNEILSTTE